VRFLKFVYSMENSDEDTFKILLATDVHLGYGEANPIRENDSFKSFEEILQIAEKEQVDFVLLGGDLFHETRPSPYCINKCTELIRKYCLGDKPVEIEFLSDPSFNFQNSTVNYEDPNMNVSIPIFSIHGNHDDPTGKRQISAMDLMSSMGLINYFGRWDKVTQVEVNPILLKKGTTRLALYGLSHIRDERLARLFIEKKVIMKTPEDVNEWFNVLILHQNRANRGAKNFIAESFIPEFIDLVMWGHEHDCKIEAVQVADGRAYITQPGSSVATSLAEGEALTKKVGLLQVSGRDFSILPVELRTVRPFIFKHMILDAHEVEGKISHADKAKTIVSAKIEEMIQTARQMGARDDWLPLIRLIVKYQDERQVFNAIRFGQGFANKVANPEDAVKFVSLQKKTRRGNVTMNGEDVEDLEIEQVDRVEDLLAKYFNETNQLKVLSIRGLNEAVKRFIDANDTDAPSYIIENQETYTLEKLIELKPEEDELEGQLERMRAARDPNDFKNLLNNPNRPKPSNDDVQIGSDNSDNEATS
jgi:double-strand break repair protein MRE11